MSALGIAIDLDSCFHIVVTDLIPAPLLALGPWIASDLMGEHLDSTEQFLASVDILLLTESRLVCSSVHFMKPDGDLKN